MATVASTSPESPTPGSPGFVLHHVTWGRYLAMLKDVEGRPIRIIYDQGTMEVVVPSFEHEEVAYRLGRIVDVLTEELEIAVKAGRTTTHKREDLDRGAEPDQCYWFGPNARTMAGKSQLDLAIDPPPDLAIEVDITRSSLDRLPIFGSIGIPEIWRFADGALEFLQLQPDSGYQPGASSLAFPTLSAVDLIPFLDQGQTAEDTTWVRSFRAFVREVLTQRP